MTVGGTTLPQRNTNARQSTTPKPVTEVIPSNR